jgi:IS30 family transposase
MAERIDWKNVLGDAALHLSDEDRRIVGLLALGSSTPEIARELGQHRSMIWRKMLRIRLLLKADSGQ